MVDAPPPPPHDMQKVFLQRPLPGHVLKNKISLVGPSSRSGVAGLRLLLYLRFRSLGGIGAMTEGICCICFLGRWQRSLGASDRSHSMSRGLMLGSHGGVRLASCASGEVETDINLASGDINLASGFIGRGRDGAKHFDGINLSDSGCTIRVSGTGVGVEHSSSGVSVESLSRRGVQDGTRLRSPRWKLPRKDAEDPEKRSRLKTDDGVSPGAL